MPKASSPKAKPSPKPKNDSGKHLGKTRTTDMNDMFNDLISDIGDLASIVEDIDSRVSALEGPTV